MGRVTLNAHDATLLDEAPDVPLLAWRWAEYLSGEAWETMSYDERSDDVATLLAILREARTHP